MIAMWLSGLLRRRPWALLGPIAGVTVAVALLASLGMFLAASKATMTERATASVSVDWQVQVQADANPASVQTTVAGADGTVATTIVDFAKVPRLTATTGGTTQTTGAGVIVGIPENYRALFPSVVRTLSGSPSGVLVAQQTAANLHVGVGDTLRVDRPGSNPATLHVDAVVDMPTADSFFQIVGAPTGSQPIAPPDNVILIPATRFATDFALLSAISPDAITHQIQALRSHDLPPDPADAYTVEVGKARNLEVRSAGAALVGDNLGATLDAARKDALYAQTLFLFLGAPGAILAGLLTAVVASAAVSRRRRDQAILRTRGATRRQLAALVGAEAAIVGLSGSIAGLLVAALFSRAAFGTSWFGSDATSSAVWLVAACAMGLLVAALAIIWPMRADLREGNVNESARTIRRDDRMPGWARYGVDVILLAASFAIFRVTSGADYALILAPEGVPTISVNYWAFLGPTLLWLGSGLLALRLTGLLLRHGRGLLTAAARPVAGRLAPVVAASLSRQRRAITGAVVLLALALSFAISTATFNATYQQQAEVDARLTNGADVTVTPAPGSSASVDAAGVYASIPGVVAVEPIQHRYAYVGADLQDLYGVTPATISTATSLTDAYFSGGTTAQLMDALASTPSGLLVSDETVKDFQLVLGDTLKLRMTRPKDGSQVTVPFHYIGVAKEFPTAPRDSFLIANADYVARQTGSGTVGAFLLNTNGANISAVAEQARAIAGPTATVSEIGAVRGVIGSSLTSVDLTGLTRVELTFAVALAAASGGLVLWLGLVERRRMFAILRLLGAQSRDVSGFVITEVALTLLLGSLAGVTIGWLTSQMLVSVLTGVFDPPPASLAVPWPYFAALAMTVTASLTIAGWAAIRQVRIIDASALRAD